MKTNEIEVRAGLEHMDFKRVTEMLSCAEWSKGIGMDEVKHGASNAALVVGAFHENVQVGYARAISDKTRFAYISDVYVDDRFRHMGIAKKMVAHLLSHDSLKDVYQWVLKTEVEGVYESMGFAPVSKPERWLEIRKERPKR